MDAQPGLTLMCKYPLLSHLNRELVITCSLYYCCFNQLTQEGPVGAQSPICPGHCNSWRGGEHLAKQLSRVISSVQDSLIVTWWRNIDYLNTIIPPSCLSLRLYWDVHHSLICHHFILNWPCLMTGSCWVLGYRMPWHVPGSHTLTTC